MCNLTIHVRMADDRQDAANVQVQLLNTAGPLVGSATTHADGRAEFQVSSGVTYRVRVSGRGVETAESEFFIMGGQFNQTENLNVKPAAAATQDNKSPPVSVAEMQVPAKAREQMQKALEAFDKGDTGKATQRFEKAIEIYPQYARAYENLGVIAAKSGDRAKARSLYTKAIELDERLVPAYVQLVRLEILEKNYTQAETLLHKVMLLFPEMPDLIALLAGAEYGNKEYANALADAQRVHALPHHDKVADVHLLAAELLEMKNRNQEAVAEYRMYLAEAPNSPQTKAVQQAITDLEALKR
jgi:tetratricopeptide (TPR) repeat protein